MKLCKDCGSEMNYVMSFQMENNKVKQVGYYVINVEIVQNLQSYY